MLATTGDVSGLWTGTIDIHDESSGTNITTPVRIELNQQPDAISGKIGRPEDLEVVPIKNVRMEGNKIWFEASNGSGCASGSTTRRSMRLFSYCIPAT